MLFRLEKERHDCRLSPQHLGDDSELLTLVKLLRRRAVVCRFPLMCRCCLPAIVRFRCKCGKIGGEANGQAQSREPRLQTRSAVACKKRLRDAKRLHWECEFNRTMAGSASGGAPQPLEFWTFFAMMGMFDLSLFNFWARAKRVFPQGRKGVLTPQHSQQASDIVVAAT